MEQDQQFVEYVIRALSDYPEAVEVTRTIDERGVLLTLRVHTNDMGRIVGRQGATAMAIRTVLRVVGSRHNARVHLKILEPISLV